MRRRRGRAAVLAMVATVGAGFGVYRFPSHRAVLAGAWLGVIGGLALYLLVTSVWDANPVPPVRYRRSSRPGRQVASLVVRARAKARPDRRRGAVPPELARMEGLVVAALTTAGGVHRRLRPLAHEIAGDRLGLSLGLRVDTGSDEVRAALGDRLWELVREHRPAPADGFARGLSLADLEVLVSALEELG